jgi:DNA-binding protein YbaB
MLPTRPPSFVRFAYCRPCRIGQVTTPDPRQAALRANVDGLLAQFEERTAQLHAAQRAAAALTATRTSPDRLVRVTVDATGMLTDLHIAATAYEHTRPDTLARTIAEVIRQATGQVRTQAADLMRPLTEGLPDLSDLVPGAPSRADALPGIPADPPRPPVSTEDDMPASWMKDDDL